MAATGGWKEHVRLWEATTGRLLREFAHTGPSVFSPDGRTLITGGRYDGKVRVWDLATGKELRQFATRQSAVSDKELRQLVATGQSAVSALAVSPDGNLLAESSLGVRLWDLRTG